MHPQLIGQIFRTGDGHTGGGDPFDCRVICQIHEQHRPVDGSGAAEIFNEEVRFLEGDAHGSEDHGEFLVGAPDLCLTGDLRRQLRMGQTGAGEHRQLLSPNQRVQPVNGRNARLDELSRIVPGGRVHRRTVDV